jgi:serine phosphatase RsbU (regulator of sigma subunit)
MLRLLTIIFVFIVLIQTHKSQCKIDTIKYFRTLETIQKKENHQLFTDTILTYFFNNINSCTDIKSYYSIFDKTYTFLNSTEKKAEAYKVLNHVLQFLEQKKDTIYQVMARSKLLDFYLHNKLKNEFSIEIQKADSVLKLIKPCEFKTSTYYTWGWMAFNLSINDVSRKMFNCAYLHLMDDLKKTKRKINSFDSEILGWVGNSYIPLRKFDSAVYFRKIAMQWAKELNDHHMVADCQRYIAQTFFLNKQYDSCLHYGIPSFEFYKNENRERALWLMGSIITSSIKTKNKNVFNKYARMVEDTSFYNSKIFYYKMQKLFILSQIYNFRNDHKKALKYFENFVMLRDSLKKADDENSIKNEIAKFNLQKEIEKIKIEEIEKSKNLENKLAREKQANVFYLILGLGLTVFLSITYINLRQKKKILKVVTHQHILLEEKNKEIGDSIQYARRLQKALMAEPEVIRNELKNLKMDFGILYLPKDVVAGDFYFYHSNEKYLFLAVGDCTGHGVPGAMVSVLCMNALLQCIRDYSLVIPGEILQKARDLIVDAFSKSDQYIYDGMDCGILCINKTMPHRVYWAGANIPLWILRNQNLLIHKPDKMPVGRSFINQNFITHDISLEKNDIILLSTDGYADQFGGDKGKKMKSSNLIRWIQDNIFPIDSPEMINDKLYKLHLEWKRSQEQTDDICILTLKFNFPIS